MISKGNQRALVSKIMSFVFSDVRKKYNSLVKDALAQSGVPKEATALKYGSNKIELSEFTWYGGAFTSVYVLPSSDRGQIVEAIDNYTQLKRDSSMLSTKLTQWVRNAPSLPALHYTLPPMLMDILQQNLNFEIAPEQELLDFYKFHSNLSYIPEGGAKAKEDPFYEDVMDIINRYTMLKMIL